MELLLKAVRFAEERHRGQKRRKSGAPYIVHPLEVAEILAKSGKPESVVAAGVLHDVMEDCGVRYGDLKKIMGDEIAALVREVSDFPGESEEEIRVRLSTTSYFAKCIKLADIASNARDLASHDARWALPYLAKSEALVKAIRASAPADPYLDHRAQSNLEDAKEAFHGRRS